MSKQIKRKITVNLSSKSKDISKPRPSVFERLGTKANPTQDTCHHWAQNGTCPYGKGCKYSSTHTLISPSKQRAAKNQSESKRSKENAHKRLQAENGEEDSYQWDPEELADADPDDLEKRRQELQRELDLQMKMESKARKKDKKIQKESSPSTESSSSSSESTSSSEDSSTTSSSTETRRKKNKKLKMKRESSSSSDDRPPKKKAKLKQSSMKSAGRDEKSKKNVKTKPAIKSPTPVRSRRQSQTPPPKIKPGVLLKSVEPKSPRSISRSSDRKEKHHTPSPKPKEKDKDREKEKERDREKEREREREKDKTKERIKEKEREKEKDYKKKEYRSPKRENKTLKENKKRDTPDSSYSRDRKSSPNRSKVGGSNTSKRDNHKSPPPKEEKNRDKKDDKDRSRIKERQGDEKSRRDKQESRDRERDRERERERRLTREEREAAREKEREEALARCQERQRERERLKELAKKEEERNRCRDRGRREDRNFDKQLGDRSERLLSLTEDRISTSRKHSSEREKSDRRDRDRRDRTPERKKSMERREEKDRVYERNYDRSTDRNYDRESRDHDRDRDIEYSRVREPERRLEDKGYESPYDRTRHDDRRYIDVEDHYTDNSRDERLPMERDYPEERRSRRDHWNTRDDRDLELEHRRYVREDSRPPATLKGRDWENDYPDHDWDRARRPIDWDGRDNWDSVGQKHVTDEEWRLYNWSADDRRRWPNDWRERSRPRSSTSHTKEEDSLSEARKKDISRQDPRSDQSDSKTSVSEVEIKKEAVPIAKRSVDDPPKSPVEIKRLCAIETALEDDLSEISDDADDILNRDEEILESVTEIASLSEPIETSSVKEHASAASQKSQSPNRSPNQLPKDESIDEENMDLDFEEISEDELEEELRVKGIGDALGVDWASLVTESRSRVQSITSTKRQWDSHNVLMNLGISTELAGHKLVEDILIEHMKAKNKDQGKENDEKLEGNLTNLNGLQEETERNLASDIAPTIGAIQVVKMEKQALRKTLFCVAGLNCRALSARRDLMIRRHLCNLPLHDAYVDVPKRHDPELLKLAVQMFEKCL